MKSLFLFVFLFTLERANLCLAEDATEPAATEAAEVTDSSEPALESEPASSEKAPEPAAEPEPPIEKAAETPEPTAKPEPTPTPTPAPVSEPVPAAEPAPTASETQTSSSPFALGIQGGQTFSNSSTTGNRQKTEIFGGVHLEWRLIDHLSLQAELNYIEKGWRPVGGLLQDEVSLKYLEAPLFLKAKWTWNNLVPHVFAGPSVAYLHAAEQIDNGILFDTTSGTTRVEYGIYVGAGLDILLSQDLEVGGNVRYGWGLSDLSENVLEPDVFNRVFQWVATLRFRI